MSINTAPGNICAPRSRNLISAIRTVRAELARGQVAASRLEGRGASDAAPRLLAREIGSCPPEQKRLEAPLAFAARHRRLRQPKRP
jgi:hypothetical protein